MSIDEIVSKALLKLLVNNEDCFLANILLGLKRRITFEVDTAAVTSKELLINEHFFRSLTVGQQQFLLLHEASHIAFYDIGRLGDKCPDLWNKACDYWHNAKLVAEGHEFIEGGLLDSKYDGWEKMEIYNDILHNGQPQNQQDTMHGDMQGDPDDFNEAEIQDLIQQAAIQTRTCGGKVPDDVEKYLEELYHPKLDWKQILAKYMDSITKEDYSYQRLSKAYLPHGFVIPTLYSEGFGTLAIAIDTSGSVSDKEYELFIGGIEEIVTKCNPKEIKVVSFTTDIQKEWTVNTITDIDQLKFRSSGGTDLDCVFEHFDKQPPQVLIIFSDMECRAYTSPTTYDVINIVVGGKQYQGIGRSINIEV